MGVLYGRAGCLNTKNGDFRPGQRLDFDDPDARHVALSQTADFARYSAAVDVLHGTTGNQTYDMQVVPWANMFIGLVAVYATDKGAEGKVVNELAVSADGLHWERLNPGAPFVPHGPAGSFDSHTVYTAKPLLDPQDGTIRVYYSGGNGPHSGVRADCIGLARFRADGFAGWAVGAQAGTVETRALNATWEQLRGLRVNADVVASLGGSVRVDALDGRGRRVISRSEPINMSVSDARGNNLAWSSPVPGWAATRSIVLNFAIVDATVFSFVFGSRQDHRHSVLQP
jgi:hypothetical protein